MNLHVDVERLIAAHETVRSELLGERTVGGHWVGELSSSPLATAAAVSALVVAHGNGGFDVPVRRAERTNLQDMLQGDLSELIVESLHWLAERQNEDGGWGDTERGRSNIAATLLVQAAFRLTCVPAKYEGLTDRADEFLESQGGIAALAKALRPRQESHGADPGECGARRTGALATGARPALRIHRLAAELVRPLAAAGRELRDSGARGGRAIEVSSRSARAIRSRACCGWRRASEAWRSSSGCSPRAAVFSNRRRSPPSS